MTTTIVDELMGLVAAVTDASGLDFSAYVAARSKLESRLRELLIGEAVKLPAAIDYGRNATHYQSGEEEGWNACLDELAKLGPLYLAPRPFDAGAISDAADAARWRWLKPKLRVELVDYDSSEGQADDIRYWTIVLSMPADLKPDFQCCGAYGVNEHGQRDCGFCPKGRRMLGDASIDTAMRTAIATLVQP